MKKEEGEKDSLLEGVVHSGERNFSFHGREECREKKRRGKEELKEKGKKKRREKIDGDREKDLRKILVTSVNE